jgi:hypothetical protein
VDDDPGAAGRPAGVANRQMNRLAVESGAAVAPELSGGLVRHHTRDSLPRDRGPVGQYDLGADEAIRPPSLPDQRTRSCEALELLVVDAGSFRLGGGEEAA